MIRRISTPSEELLEGLAIALAQRMRTTSDHTRTLANYVVDYLRDEYGGFDLYIHARKSPAISGDELRAQRAAGKTWRELSRRYRADYRTLRKLLKATS